jgi:hypothetical protein
VLPAPSKQPTAVKKREGNKVLSGMMQKMKNLIKKK